MNQPNGRSFDLDADVVTYPKTRVETLALAGITYMRITLEPGWRWSECVGPALGMTRCPKHHRGYLLAGRLAVTVNDGEPREFVAGDVYEFPPGHDAWVVGDEAVVHLDIVVEAANGAGRDERDG
ncbi:MAG TPA: cupin domain-containing protein [Nitrolancea sp.]|nr:cupin domain-containing protein [Nitrolancea sp.]